MKKLRTLISSCLFITFILFMFNGCIGSTENDTYYDVTFETGTDLVIETAKVKSGTLIKDVPGYKELSSEERNFKGWKKNGSLVNPETDAVFDNITLTAYWTISFTFNANGGKFSDGTTADQVREIEPGRSVIAPSVTKDDNGNTKYTFAGWSVNKYEDNEENPEKYNFDKAIEKNTTVYAYYTSGDYCTVTFKNCNKEFTKTVAAGSKLPEITSSEQKYKNSYVYFMYWSESEASVAEAEAKKFDVENTVITQDLTLYGIYTPQLNSSSTSIIEEITANSIKIQLWDSKVYTLKDGDFPGISIKYSKDKGTAVDVEKSLSSSNLTGVFGHATYSFQKLTEPGSYSFEVTNGHETGTKTFVIKNPAPVTDLSVTTDDSYATLKWTQAPGYTSYTVEAKNGNTVVATKTKCSTSAEFKGLSNDVEYTFVVTTDTTDKSASVKGTPAIVKKTSDYLMVMYLDGDNDLNDPIFLDLNETEYGLYTIRNNSGYASVNVVALWDGWSQKYNSASETGAQIGKQGSYIFEVGTDYSNSITSTTSAGCVLSSSTKDLSYTASWLKNSSGEQEVDMSNKQTLASFLTWVKDRYDADHIILQFSNHGAGPRAINPVLKTQDGKTFYNPDPYLRRAMCVDESNGGESLLLTKDIPWAITQSNIGNGKVDMIMEDVCLGASLEEAYELRNVSKYYLASPNNIPGMGFDYANLMKGFTTTNSALADGGMSKIAQNVITRYKTDYKTSASDWSAIKNEIIGIGVQNPSDETITLCNTARATLSFIDLSKLDSVKTKIDLLVDKVLEIKDNPVVLKDGETTKWQGTALNALRGCMSLSIEENDFYLSHIIYQGAYSWLHDIGGIMSDFIWINENMIKDLQLTSLCEAVQTALSDAIISSWSDGYVTGKTNGALYEKKEGSVTTNSMYSKSCYGLTVSGELVAGVISGENFTLTHGTKPDFYDTDLAFGAMSKWGQLLNAMFN